MCVYTLFLIHCPLKSLFYEGICFSNQSCVVETWTDIFFWDAGNVSETIYFLQKCCWWCVYFIFASHISASPEASQRRPSFPFLSLPQRLSPCSSSQHCHLSYRLTGSQMSSLFCPRLVKWATRPASWQNPLPNPWNPQGPWARF